MSNLKNFFFGLLASLAVTTVIIAPTSAQQLQIPNILAIMGDSSTFTIRQAEPSAWYLRGNRQLLAAIA